jgi:adenosylhomocysteine nucleosidase
MTTAIMAALPQELAAVLAKFPRESHRLVGGRQFWQGRLHGHEVVAVLAGVGKVAAASTATVLATQFGVKRMVFLGVAGGLGADVRVGDAVVASAFLQHDMDASPLFPRYEVPLTGRARFDADAALSNTLAASVEAVFENPHATFGADAVAAFGLTAPRLYRGLVISGDRFVSAQAESQALRLQLPDALAVEMEGAAVAQVCADWGLPFAAVRLISDRADDAAHVDFNQFIAAVASRFSAALVQHALPRLPA